MSDSLPASLTAFVVILAGAAMALAICGVLVGTLTQRYRKQFLEVMQKYLGVRDEHEKVLTTLEKTLAKMGDTKRESVLVSNEREQVTAQSGKLQDRLIARERKVNDLSDETRDLKAQLDRQVTAFVELEKLAQTQQAMLTSVAHEMEKTQTAANTHKQQATERAAMIRALEARLKEAQSRASISTQSASQLQQHNARMQTALASHESATAFAQRSAMEAELKLAGNSDKMRNVDRTVEQNDRHAHTIAELNSNLGQARERLEELERERNVSSSDLAAISDRLRAAEENAATATHESRERLAALQSLTQDLNQCRLAMRDAQLLSDQHAAMNREQLTRQSATQRELDAARIDAGEREAMISRLTAQVRNGATPEAFADTRASFAAEALSPEHKTLINRVKAAPGNQGVLTKLAAELLGAQKELGQMRGRMDELSAAQLHAPAADDSIAEIDHLRDQLETSRGRQSEQSEKISTLMSRVKDLEKRYDEARHKSDEMHKAVGKIDAERQALARQVEQGRRFPNTSDEDDATEESVALDGDETDIEQATARGIPGADSPRFISQNSDLPRFVQSDERIAIEPPLESIRGLTVRDINALRVAAVMTVADLAALTPQRLETIVRATMWRKPDYQAMLRQARQLAALE